MRKKNKWRYILTDEDIQDVARGSIGRKLTAEEVRRAGKYFDNGNDCMDILEIAVDEAVSHTGGN